MYNFDAEIIIEAFKIQAFEARPRWAAQRLSKVVVSGGGDRGVGGYEPVQLRLLVPAQSPVGSRRHSIPHRVSG